MGGFFVVPPGLQPGQPGLRMGSLAFLGAWASKLASSLAVNTWGPRVPPPWWAVWLGFLLVARPASSLVWPPFLACQLALKPASSSGSTPS
jgi:hypothetical protein